MAGCRISVGVSYARTNLPLPVSIITYNANNQLNVLSWCPVEVFQPQFHFYRSNIRQRVSTPSRLEPFFQLACVCLLG